MSQEDINQDLGHYIKEKHKKVPFWKKFKSKLSSKEDVQEDIKHELEAEEKTEDITPEDKEELEEMEDKIVEVNNVQNGVEEELDEKREGLLNRFFKKLNFGKKEHESGYEEDEDDSKEHDEHEESADEISDEEMKQFLKNMHSWITQLSSEKQQEFKESKDFELYTKVLKKHNLIK